MKISELLYEGYPETIAAFNQMAKPDEVKKAIDQYRDLVNKNQVTGDKRNIDWWKKQGWEKFQDFVTSKSTQATKTQVKRKLAAGKSIVLKETPDWLIVIPLDHDASCYHGRNTEWCTARQTSHHFDHYFLDRDVVLIYCLNKKTGEKWAIASHPDIDTIEMFDKTDQSMNYEQFQSATGFNPYDLVKLIPHNDPRIAQVKTTRKNLIADVDTQLKNWLSGDKTRNEKLEQILIKTKHPRSCFIYTQSVFREHGAQEFPRDIALTSVRYEPDALEYIKNPHPVVVIAAIKGDPSLIQDIKNPSEAMQMAAVTSSGDAIRYIINNSDTMPSEAVQLAAVKNHGLAINYIMNNADDITPSEAVQLAAVKQNHEAIYFIVRHGITPSEDVQMATVIGNPSMITYIKHPAPAVIIAAIEKNKYVINEIIKKLKYDFGNQDVNLAMLVNTDDSYNLLKSISAHDRLDIKMLLQAVTHRPSLLKNVIGAMVIAKKPIPDILTQQVFDSNDVDNVTSYLMSLAMARMDISPELLAKAQDIVGEKIIQAVKTLRDYADQDNKRSKK